MKRAIVPDEFRDKPRPSAKWQKSPPMEQSLTRQQELRNAMEALPTPAQRGRPSLYKPEYDVLIEAFHMAGLTIKAMCQILAITDQTYYHWCHHIDSFSSAVKRGRELADAQVALSLFHRATGYSHPATDMRVIDGVLVETEYTKHYPPDTTALNMWLVNRQPGKWRNASQVDHRAIPGAADTSRPPAITVNAVRANTQGGTGNG